VTTTDTATAARQAMAEGLRRRGFLDDPRWYRAFAEVPRESFLPAGFLRQGFGPTGAEWATMRPGAEGYLGEVYRDAPLVTQVGGHTTPADLEDGATAAGDATCSSTQPSLMALMLDALGIEDGMRVIEIGTGVGYNAAILAHRLGPANLTSIEYDPGLAESARTALHAYTGSDDPLVITGDGAAGHPGRAPYDRLIATCSFPAIPAAWLQQLRPGALLIANLYRPLNTGILALLRIQDDHTALGRIAPHYGGFMPTRTTAGIDPLARHKETWRELEDAETRPSDLGLAVLEDDGFRLHASFTLNIADLRLTSDDPDEQALWLFGADGSAARATPSGDGTTVIEHGPTKLWTALEQAHEQYQQLGRPHRGTYRITATSADQHIWHPADPEQRWRLDT
jgi:methyltransferase of ATP-grasp peptide maturase system